VNVTASADELPSLSLGRARSNPGGHFDWRTCHPSHAGLRWRVRASIQVASGIKLTIRICMTALSAVETEYAADRRSSSRTAYATPWPTVSSPVCETYMANFAGDWD
jgi:hypothetical protein